jgi:hypothetical protein
MSMLIKETPNVDNVLEIVIDDEITKDDVEELEMKMEKLKKNTDKVNFLVQFADAEGYTVKGMIQDMKAFSKHSKDVEKIALFSNTDSKWVEFSNKIDSLVPGLETKEFELGQREEALKWLQQ